ncbi:MULTISPECIES: phage portal protein [Pseudomonadaceae]|uniref:Putative portal protein n=1 Tax=viral metagenome TaxID=1070528 RepID=A0A6H1ZTJ9_9ZZZZ|nr:phage portal protein [Pseudomonas sp. Choline-3u-10]
MFGRKNRELQATLAAQAERMAALEGQLANVANSDRAPVSTGDRESILELFNVASSYAGPVVNAQTAMRSSAVYACVSIIAGAIASLPLPVYQRTDDGRERADHPFWWMLNEQAGPCFTAYSFWEYMISAKLLRGDAHAYIVRNGAGVPQELLPLPRHCVIAEKRNGRLVYFVDLDGEYLGLDQDDVLHFPSLGFDGVKSPSVISLAAKQSVGVSLAAEEYAARFFSNGMRSDFALSHPGNPTKAQVELIREMWAERHQGPAKNHLPAVLVGGMEVKELTMSAEDSQLLETRKWQVVDIARAFGVPPHMIGETEKSSSWGSGIEQMSIGFVRWTLNRHLKPIEQELNRKLWPSSPRYFVEFNREGLMAGDSKAEAEYFTKALGGPGAQGYMTVNEVRRIKNLPPVEGGDTLYRPENPNATQQIAEPDSGQPEGDEALRD